MATTSAAQVSVIAVFIICVVCYFFTVPFCLQVIINGIEMAGYKWIGHNRSEIHVRGEKGSGGVGFLVRSILATQYNIEVIDSSKEGILWISLEHKDGKDGFKACVCYLPPVNSTRNDDANEFYDALLSQVHMYGKDSLFLLCGDFNSRCSNFENYIPGVDKIPERNIVDFKSNLYGELLCEYLINSSCCILNGRNCVKNNYTYVSQLGSSVVDYCIVPYESLNLFESFEVITMSELLEKHKLLEYADPRVSKPDHSMLIWNINIDKIVRGNMNEEINTCEYKKYDLNNIPSSFLATHLHKIEDLISSLEVQSANCSEIDQIYSDFVNLLKVEMTENLSYKVIKMSSGLLSNKRRRIKKPWWTDKLTQLWNNVCVAEKAMLESKSDSRKRQCRIEFIDKRKTFDREAQRAKRTHWRKQMVEIDDMETTNHSEFWKKIGRIGVGTERRKLIPMSVQLPDGSIAHGREAVVTEWKRSYCSLLNPETVNSEYVMDQRLDTEIEMNNEITSFEVVNAVRSLKRNKAVGVDEIPAEILKVPTNLFNDTDIDKQQVNNAIHVKLMSDFKQKWNEDLHKDTTRRNGPGGVLYYGGQMSCTQRVEQNKHLPIIYVITPTYKRLTQIPELTRLGNTLRNVPAVHWVVVEEGNRTLEEVRHLLMKIDIQFTYLSATRYKHVPNTLKGIHQRNEAIFWLRNNIDISKDGVVYFADDDNTYDLEIFTEMRYTKKISVWPVGFVSKKKYQTPILENGKVVKFDAWNTKHRQFPIDMAGFALNTKTFYYNDDLYFRRTFQKGYQESSFLEICCTLNDLEPKANGCTKIFSSEGCWVCANECLQILGGLGYMKDYPYERLLRDGRILMIFEGTNEILRMFVALQGCQHAGKQLKDLVKKLRNPLANPGLFFGTLKKRMMSDPLKPALKLHLDEEVHPSLKTAAQSLGDRHFYIPDSRKSIREKVVHEQLDLKRLANIVIDLYAMTSCIARTSRSLSIGLRNSDHELLITNTFCYEADLRIKHEMQQLLKGKTENTDETIHKIADLVFKNKGYAASHPLDRNW
ncbi:ACAD9 [Mytilus edulis]|uniref:Galactosylgalactosylxylosylprotein 3-beta-glucuronosyltransferase n=1 Tax=Mytilus edulis TaxID=6550 RepID=A0A8S3QEV7_MYTED|nr:ACAD9 [Mytilus edulis]